MCEFLRQSICKAIRTGQTRTTHRVAKADGSTKGSGDAARLIDDRVAYRRMMAETLGRMMA